MQTYKMPKTLHLDYSIWRCGGVFGEADKLSSCKVGTGGTSLLNPLGKMCCLGQFSLESGVSKENLLNQASPRYLLDNAIKVLPLVRIYKDKSDANSAFGMIAMEINDNPTTTVAQKAVKLKALCKKYRRKLILKNFPKEIRNEIRRLTYKGKK